MEQILYQLKVNFNVTLLVLFIIISIILYFYDRKRFIRSNDKKEEVIAKVLGYVYFWGGIIIFFALRIFA
ncbi:MAG: CLC_0170 family protein [Eubacteriales bacterium]